MILRRVSETRSCLGKRCRSSADSPPLADRGRFQDYFGADARGETRSCLGKRCLYQADSLPLADRCRQLAKRHPTLYCSDQVPKSDKKRAHHSHMHRHNF